MCYTKLGDIMNFLFNSFFQADKPIVWLVIFLAKITEVSLSTLRIILVNKGHRNIGFLLAAVEIALWIVVVSNVITELTLMKGVMYGLGFAVGVYLGSLIENKLAIGNILIQAIVSEESGELIAKRLRDNGFGVTTMDGKGIEKTRKVLLVYAKRKSSISASSIITEIEPKAMIISHESRAITGGYTTSARGHLFK